MGKTTHEAWVVYHISFFEVWGKYLGGEPSSLVGIISLTIYEINVYKGGLRQTKN